MIQFDEHICQMGWNHQLVLQFKSVTSKNMCVLGVIFLGLGESNLLQLVKKMFSCLLSFPFGAVDGRNPAPVDR